MEIIILVAVVLLTLLGTLINNYLNKDENVLEELLPKVENKELDENSPFKKLMDQFIKKEELEIPIGWNEENEVVTLNFKTMKNLLIVGTTGGGKSISINDIISSIIMNYSKEEIKILPFDTCIVELSAFNGIPHYVQEPLASPKDLEEALEKLSTESEKRLKKEDNPFLLVIIDDLYDVLSNDSNNKQLLERLMRDTEKTNIHFILVTDTPTDDVLKSLRNFLEGTLYVTLAPGEEKDFSFEQELEKEEWEYLTTIGNAIYRVNDEKSKVKIPDITEEEIKIIKESLR
jgi:Cdc6-like AAA superfamily ATPase